MGCAFYGHGVAACKDREEGEDAAAARSAFH
jgi:hypothetical protein